MTKKELRMMIFNMFKRIDCETCYYLTHGEDSVCNTCVATNWYPSMAKINELVNKIAERIDINE